MAQATKRSTYYTPDIAVAGLVLVDFHCYVQAWLSAGRELNNQTKRDELKLDHIHRVRKLMVHIQSTPRFQARAAEDLAVWVVSLAHAYHVAALAQRHAGADYAFL